MSKRTPYHGLTPDPKNANKGTPRGQALLEDSLRRYGAGRSILVDKYGMVIAGNKTLEAAADIGLADPVVVPSDGRRLVVVQRTDLDLAQDVEAKELALADNRVAQVSLDWDVETLTALAAEGVDLSKLWTDEELKRLLDGVPLPDPMPQLEPQLESEALVTIRCTRGALESMTNTLNEWATRPDVTIDIS